MSSFNFNPFSNNGSNNTNHANLCFVIVGILCLVWIININYQSYLINNMIGGFWDASPDFCQESGLDMFCIYFENEVGFNGERACYILAKMQNEVIINEPTVAKISLSWMSLNNWSSNLKVPKFLKIEFKTLSNDCPEDFLQTQSIRFYPLTGKLVLFYKDTITAVLYKNTINSELDELLKQNPA